MRYPVEPVFGEQGFHRGAVGEVDAGHREARVIVEDRRARASFSDDVVVVVEVVEADDLVATLEQALAQ